MKKIKNELKRDSVSSETIHVGIELELFKEGYSDSHDDDACRESAYERHEDYLNNECGIMELLSECLGVEVNRSQADLLESYLDRDSIISDAMRDFEHTCDDSECPYNSGIDRGEVAADLRRLTGNSSFKCVEDGSIYADDSVGAEVCWNYFVSKETVKDNAKIMEWLKSEGFQFNKSCGLHINLNNYLKLSDKTEAGHSVAVGTHELDFLFNYVAASRRGNKYCRDFAIADYEKSKYSMINIQGDRLEFRFFSPTLDAVKLNHYVRLAHHVYKRLAGINCKLPKKTQDYFIKKMIDVNGLDPLIAQSTIMMTNSIKPLTELNKSSRVNDDMELDEVV